MKINKLLKAIMLATPVALVACGGDSDSNKNSGSNKDESVASNFARIATFPVCREIDDNCDTDTETAAEIVDASEDGNTLIYTDSPVVSLVSLISLTPATPSRWVLWTLAVSRLPLPSEGAMPW